MNLTQLNPTLPMTVEGKGSGYAVAVIDYGPEHHLIWVVAIDATGEIWSTPNPQVRMQSNWTMGRKKPPQTMEPLAKNVEPIRAALKPA